MTSVPGRVPRSSRWALAIAATAVAYAAADTYVVVVALPDMMSGVGLPLTELQRAAPIVSGFLLGYVAMLPLIGRIADLRGRIPVLRWGLFLFALGSLVTAVAYSLSWLIAGRFLQGVGGGALVPATLALVADMYPAGRRSIPLGIVSAVQEIGSVLGPLLGAVILVVAGWRGIFAVNVAVAAALLLALRIVGPRGRPDWIGAALGSATLAVAGLVFYPPDALKLDLTWGELYVPHGPQSRWTTWMGIAALVLAGLTLLWCASGRSRAVDLRDWWRSARDVDLVGAGLLGATLGGIVLAFATADPQVQVFSAGGLGWLALSGVSAVAFVMHSRRAHTPLIPRGALTRRPAWGGIAVSLLVGASLVAALVDVPLFARSTVADDSQVKAALVLVRFLVALPIGAYAGGHLTHRLTPRIVASAGLALAALGFAGMATWQAEALNHPSATVELALCGFGFGLALAPINSAVLGSVDEGLHGLASALTVVARMIGMLVGISGLTTLGLHAFYRQVARLPSVASVCGHPGSCRKYEDLVTGALLSQERWIFAGAGLIALLAAALAVIVLGGRIRAGTAMPIG